MLPWQRIALVLLPAILAAGIAFDAALAIRILTLTLLFVPVVALRVIAVAYLLAGKRDPGSPPSPRTPEAGLPIYTLLVPLYREANVVAALMQALARLDWPAEKLDIKLILEAADAETIAALDLAGNVEIVVVPDLAPQTKPKALNYALPLARGEYLVIRVSRHL